MPADSGAHLTTSRINRLLRPLRNKCNSLVALPKAPSSSRAAYSTRRSSWDPDSHPPLAILSARTKKLVLDSCSADDFELSRRIHAVCDAFKNIAHVAFGQPCSKRIPSLAVLCCLVVGENMPPENTLTDPGEDSADDILDVGGIYETVPSHYRRFLIVSHALSMILSTCTHHHTLVTLLLDHCLSFGLVHESTHLLNIVLSQALLPYNSSCPPPAMHPSHTNYLLDLHTKWTAGNKLSGTFSATLLFTTSAFCRVLIDALSKSSSCNLHKIWTSNVLSRLLHAVGSCDIDSYIIIVHTLSRSFLDDATETLNQSLSEPETEVASPDTLRNKAQPAPLRGKLSELMSNLFDLLFAPHNSHSSLLEPPQIYAAIDILRDCYVARLHRFRMPTTGSSVDLPDVIVTFATHIFVAFRNCVDNFDSLLALLDDSSPAPTTFSKLMVYINRFQGSQTFGDFVEAFLSELKLYSSALCSEKLFKLDASLWACALHHFETSIATSQKGSPTLVIRYKQQLMDAVDKAEHRCYGGLVNSLVVSSNRLTHAGRTHHARTSGHWEWEDMVGSWFRKTPVHKKRRIDHSPLLRCSYSQPAVSSVELSTPDSTPLSTRHRRSSTFSSSSYFPSSDHGSRTDDGSEYQGETDKENYPSGLPKTVKGFNRRTKRRSSNFFSLLADAQINRIVLHPKPRLKLRSPSFIIPEKYALPLSSQEAQNAPCTQALCRNISPSPVPLETLLPSDDSLNLFAYATSSPTRC